MTYGQYVALVEGHNAMYSKRGRRRVDPAGHADIAALKYVRVASG